MDGGCVQRALAGGMLRKELKVDIDSARAAVLIEQVERVRRGRSVGRTG